MLSLFFFFNDTATTEIYTLSLHDALPILRGGEELRRPGREAGRDAPGAAEPVEVRHQLVPLRALELVESRPHVPTRDRKSTRLNSSHANISYAVFCLKKKQNKYNHIASMY